MKIGFYDPYLATLGGGEKVLLTILDEALAREHEVTALSPERPETKAWSQLGVDVHPDSVQWRRATDSSLSRVSGGLDRLVTLHNGAPPPHLAPSGIAIIQFPFRAIRRAPGRPVDPVGFVRRRQIRRGLRSYQRVLCYSAFVAREIAIRLGVQDSVVLPPPVDSPVGEPVPKERRILAVGRFFVGGHTKRQDVLVEAFADLLGRCPAAAGWSLHLAGGVAAGRSHARYVARLRREAAGLPVSFHLDAPLEELRNLYRRSSLFWHAAGFNADERRHPQRLEHFGITPAEAMGYGCIPMVVARGGLVEVIAESGAAVGWSHPDELVKETCRLIEEPDRMRKWGELASRAAGRYSTEAFRRRVHELILSP